jgi:hypothetical protein
LIKDYDESGTTSKTLSPLSQRCVITPQGRESLEPLGIVSIMYCTYKDIGAVPVKGVTDLKGLTQSSICVGERQVCMDTVTDVTAVFN